MFIYIIIITYRRIRTIDEKQFTSTVKLESSNETVILEISGSTNCKILETYPFLLWYFEPGETTITLSPNVNVVIFISYNKCFI